MFIDHPDYDDPFEKKNDSPLGFHISSLPKFKK